MYTLIEIPQEKPSDKHEYKFSDLELALEAAVCFPENSLVEILDPKGKTVLSRHYVRDTHVQRTLPGFGTRKIGVHYDAP